MIGSEPLSARARVPDRPHHREPRPADLRKKGAAFDLPVAVSILCATGLVKLGRLDRALVMGELSLDGSVRPVRGVRPVALHTRREGFAPLLVPAANAAEASVVGASTSFPSPPCTMSSSI